ncbi:MAG: phenylacetate-CoA oxygenase subunit PaaC [Planctomycetes bacterium]|nr:phenylacetate-CoA oxygenase subunit PaaC [Planctomycetota bacterium]
MTRTFETLLSLDAPTRQAIVDLLYRLADDAMIIGHRDSEWTGLGPILEEDIAFSSMAQDEMGHAHVFYQMLCELGQPDPDTLAFNRKPREWRCCSLVSLPAERDWALAIVRKFLYDAAESVRLAALSDSALRPLAFAATKLRGEKKYHLMHTRAWVLRLGAGTSESRARIQAALDAVYPHALGMFEPTEADEVLAQADIAPREKQLRREWESAAAPVLAEAGLVVGDNVRPVFGGRVGRHPEALSELLTRMQLVYQLDPQAKW